MSDNDSFSTTVTHEAEIDAAFAERIRARFPEGLTAAFAIGGTRTAFILENNQSEADPGSINTKSYAATASQQYRDMIQMFYDLGGQNLVIPLLSHQLFYERGQDYTDQYIQFTTWLIEDAFSTFYEENHIDPYFTGIDILAHLPAEDPAYQLGETLRAFQDNWQYQDDRRKLIWEIAPIPLYTFWQTQFTKSPEEQAEIAEKLNALTDMREINAVLFHYYAKAAFGVDIPIPHFYLGSNRNGDMKLRSPMLLSLVCGGEFRVFYTPYPSLFTPRETIKTIISDIAFGAALRSFKPDYSGQITTEMIDAERERVFTLRDDPFSTMGLTRPQGK